MKTQSFINPLKDREKPISLSAFGCGRADPSFCRGPLIRNEYVLHYITEGICYYEVGTQKYTVTPGDAFVIFPNEVIKYYTDKDKLMVGYWLDIVGTRCEEYLREAGLSQNRLVIHGVSASFGKTVLAGLERANSGCPQLCHEACILECLSCVADADVIQDKGLFSMQTCVKNAIAYMKYAYPNKINVSDVAEYVGFERSYFYRVFKEETGVSPSEYLTRLRIRRAKELLSAGESVKVTAYSVGIDDIYYFSKLFVNKTGVTPSEFKKQHSISEV